MPIEITALSTLPEVRSGDDLASLIRTAAAKEQQSLDESVVVAVAQQAVSKAEGAIVDLREIEPSALARSWAAEWGKDPRLIELILTQARRIVKMDRGVLITETHLGLVCANTGVDRSNAENADVATILPRDPDASARHLCAAPGLRCRAGDRHLRASVAPRADGCGDRRRWSGAIRGLSRVHRPARQATVGHDNRGCRSTCLGCEPGDGQSLREPGGANPRFRMANKRGNRAR
jgi:F420-0:Gamma-glutamyl ligase